MACDKFVLEQLNAIPDAVIFDRIVAYLMSLGHSRARALKAGRVFGVILHYERLANKSCYAAATTVADKSFCCVRTFYRYRDTLVRHNLIIDHNRGLRNKPHNYTVSTMAYKIVFGPDSSDILAQDSSDILALEEDDNHDDNLKYTRLNNDLSNLVIFEAEFGRPKNGLLARIEQLHADPTIPPAWLNKALMATAAKRPNSPLAYLNRVIADYQANGGPAASGAAPAGQPVEEPPALIKAVREEWESRPGTGKESKIIARRDHTIERVIKTADKNNDIDRWMQIGWDDDQIIAYLAGLVDTALSEIKKPPTRTR